MPHAVSRRVRARRPSGLGAGLLARGRRVRLHGLSGLGAGLLARSAATGARAAAADATGAR
jgi:hypothetical protein